MGQTVSAEVLPESVVMTPSLSNKNSIRSDLVAGDGSKNWEAAFTHILSRAINTISSGAIGTVFKGPI